MTDAASSQPPLQLLGETERLLREGMKRIAQVQTDLPSAQSPLEEALRLTEEQAMTTLTAVERAQEALAEIRKAHGVFIDGFLDHIDQALGIILASQQGQDLAGQRLKKAIALLNAVEERIGRTVRELGIEGEPEEVDGTAADTSARFAQDDVDALLAELGI
ncbi:MAG: hypothetical protein RE468_10360 [Acidithiobacillus caldus]|jgi:chemotaxis protein CheZ|uniref:Chemotaxis protein CheZ n=1 Tax=Acidithiobacillus caldus (strain SM-1) TaxID=990288 RepID=F9ZPM4_ACICS|nr:hypothetical protein [Acidithiobacillus caldus]AEK56845.1 conserved hypothetical protein [Acidithiobacillus caldus SM-1]MBU2763904.1 protein phosphatase CheZ [Acidithiobacillus caldus]MBU2801886.1 protein phosphatase CheZ [Acidithiobacillus caldus]MBU2822359.1 protein phosphatase CheZ [Acidithiobacillus caldus]WMT46286.1 MAG: hypothetical protein RE468_10360 [Acidithiobacillus caldus]